MAEIGRYVRANSGLGAAQSVMRAIYDCFQMIADTEGTIGHPRDELGTGLRSFPIKSWVVYFRYRQGKVAVARVLHGRRDVGRLFRNR